eukprot:9312751-Pyramimonas_sp.AAC.1
MEFQWLRETACARMVRASLEVCALQKRCDLFRLAHAGCIGPLVDVQSGPSWRRQIFLLPIGGAEMPPNSLGEGPAR